VIKTKSLKEKLAIAKKIDKLNIEIKNHKDAVESNHRFKEYHNSRMIALIAEKEMVRL